MPEDTQLLLCKIAAGDGTSLDFKEVVFRGKQLLFVDSGPVAMEVEESFVPCPTPMVVS